jgi:ribosome-associated toxin RatA of RatAB toxin-antitoxin module
LPVRYIWAGIGATARERDVERTAAETVMRSSPDHCFAVASDVEHYPEWLPDVQQVVVLERDDEGRPRSVAFQVGAFGRSSSYILVYDYTEAPAAFSWSQREGDITYSLEGSYRFADNGDGTSTVHYELSVGLRVPLPGFVRRRAEALIVGAALGDLKTRVESLA